MRGARPMRFRTHGTDDKLPRVCVEVGARRRQPDSGSYVDNRTSHQATVSKPHSTPDGLTAYSMLVEATSTRPLRSSVALACSRAIRKSGLFFRSPQPSAATRS